MKIKKFLILLIIIVLTFTLRFILLDRIPTGISDDELDYILNAKAVFLTGKDITGNWSPFSLTPPPDEYPKAELPYLIIAPLIGPFPLSLLAARLPYVFFSVLLVVLLFLIVEKIIGKKSALIVGLVGAINPWSIYLGRTAFEAPVSTFFYLLAFYGLLLARGWRILLVFPLLFIGFYTYIGAKTTLIPFVFLISLFAWMFINQKKYTKQYALLFLATILLTVYFIFSSAKATNRTSELLTLNHPNIVQRVDKERQLSIATPVNNLFLNKAVALGKESIEKFLGFYSSGFLFLYGDSRSTFSVWHHGMFYYIDIIFLLIGLYAMYRKQKSLFFLIIGMFVIGPLPSIVSTTGITYPTRASLTFPFLIVTIGIGIWYVIDSENIKKYQKQAIITLFIIYGAFLANFMHIYVLRNPIYNSEGFGFSGRVLARYISLADTTGQSLLFVEKTTPYTVPTILKQYLFYTNQYNTNTADNIRTIVTKGNYSYKNLSIGNCPDKPITQQAVIITPNTTCKTIDMKADKLSITQLSDAGTIYNIFNDQVCKKYYLKGYPSGITLSDLDVEKLPEDKFCEKFITKF